MIKLLSVIVPSYNMEAYISRNIESMLVVDEVLRQSLEIIIVNDGSKDRTSEIAHGYSDKYPSVVTVIDKPNGNYGSCINVGLKKATGKFVKVLDADDYFSMTGFCEFLKYLRDLDASADLIISDVDVVNELGEIQERRTYEELDAEMPFSLKTFLKCKKYCSMHAYTYRTELLREMKYEQLEGVSYTDTEWVWLPLAFVSRVAYCPIVVYNYLRGREGQTMDPKIRAKNVWMYSKILIHAIWQIEKWKDAPSLGLKYVESVAVSQLRYIYQSVIFDDGIFASIDLIDFDAKLSEVSLRYYDIAGMLKYSRCLPYKFVKSWRNRSCLLPIMRLICKGYSTIRKWYDAPWASKIGRFLGMYKRG